MPLKDEGTPATGLYHVGAREYDPRTARWFQRAPIDAASGDPNPYRFCGNDPVNHLDPSGENWVDFIPIVGSGRDLIEGIQEGDWGKIAMGVGGLALDLTTGGVGGIIKGAAKGIIKSAVRQSAKQAAGGSLKQATRQGARAAGVAGGKGAAKNATRKTVKHHIMTNKNYNRGQKWSNKFEKKKLEECEAKYLLNDPANLVELAEEEHRKRAPHSNGYHRYVFQQISEVVDKYKNDPKRCQEELKKKLRELGCEIQKNPDLLRR